MTRKERGEAQLSEGAARPRIRRTRQRATLEQLMRTISRPMTAVELHMDARRVTPSLGIATVYRTLAKLEQAGILRQVQLPRDAPRYEPTSLAPHYYFRCQRCARVYWVFGRMPEVEVMSPSGFAVESHNIFLHGTCAVCGVSRPIE